MTYEQLQVFTKQVVLKYLPEIIKAEETGTSYPKELSQIARGLPWTACAIFINILRDRYQIEISI